MPLSVPVPVRVAETRIQLIAVAPLCIVVMAPTVEVLGLMPTSRVPAKLTQVPGTSGPGAL